MTSTDDGITTPPRMSRKRTRQLQKLADKIGRITQADRLFFERRPDRQHRVRLAGHAEIEQETIVRGKLNVPDGARLFVVVRNVRPGNRLRILVCGTDGNDTDLTETEAREIFEMAIAGAKA